MKQHCPVPAQPRSTPTLASIDIFFLSLAVCSCLCGWFCGAHHFPENARRLLHHSPVIIHPSSGLHDTHAHIHAGTRTQTCCGMVKYAEITPCLLFSGTQRGRGWKQVEGLKKLNARWGCAAFPRTGGGWGCHLGEQEGVPRRYGKAEGKEESDGWRNCTSKACLVVAISLLTELSFRFKIILSTLCQSAVLHLTSALL